MVKKLFFIATLLYIGATVSAENYLVKSPDGKIVAELNTNKSLSLQFKYNGSILLQESSIGVTLNDGMDIRNISYIDGTAFRAREVPDDLPAITLPSYPAMRAEKSVYARSFYLQYQNTDPFSAKRLIEPYGDREFVVQNPPQPPQTHI